MNNLRSQHSPQGKTHQSTQTRASKSPKTSQTNLSQVHQNVMEVLVAEEIDQQLKKISPRLVRYLNRIEIATFALNRLPAMYASSEEGLRKQEEKARRECKNQITKTVRQALAAVQRDPIRFSTPLLPQDAADSQEAKVALEELQDLLQQQELSWKNLAKVVKQALIHPAYRNSVVKQDTTEGFDWNNRRM